MQAYVRSSYVNASGVTQYQTMAAAEYSNITTVFLSPIMWTANGYGITLGPASSTINRIYFDCSTGWLLFFIVFYDIIISTKEDKV